MPLLNPQIEDILKSTGIVQSFEPSADPDNIIQVLKDRGMNLEMAAENLHAIIRGGGEEGTKLRATELLMKLHGVLNEKKDNDRNITIQFVMQSDITEILVPRETNQNG